MSFFLRKWQQNCPNHLLFFLFFIHLLRMYYEGTILLKDFGQNLFSGSFIGLKLLFRLLFLAPNIRSMSGSAISGATWLNLASKDPFYLTRRRHIITIPYRFKRSSSYSCFMKKAEWFLLLSNRATVSISKTISLQ